MQGNEIEEKVQENKVERLPYFAEIPLGSALVRTSGFLLFIAVSLIAILTGLFDIEIFLNIITDARITIPAILGCYLFRFVIQYLVLKFFTGLQKGQVRVGFSNLNMTPFVHSRRPYELKLFRLYLLLPFAIMSLVPFILYFVFFYPGLYVVASISAAFCVNDIISFIKSLRFPGYLLAADHPEKFGFVLYDNPFHKI